MKPVIGCVISEANYSWTPVPRDFIWNSMDPGKQKIIVLSDGCIAQIDKFLHVPKKVAWMMESPQLWRHEALAGTRKFIFKNLHKFDKVMTTEMDLVNKNPEKFVYQNQAILQVMPDETRIYEKTRFCSISAAGLKSRPGHLIRNEIAGKYKGTIKPVGKAWQSYNRNREGYMDYMFSVVTENCKVDDYFCNQILDPIACGTIPIYWGSPSIGKHFNMDGIIPFDTIEQFDDIIRRLTPDNYWERFDAVKENLEILKAQYRMPEDTMWNNVLKSLYEEACNK